MGETGNRDGIRAHVRSNVVGYVALFAVLAGGTASALPGKNKVDSGDIKNGQVKSLDIGADAVGSTAVGADALGGSDIDESSLDLPTAPNSLPPSGAAGGDLSGTYPNPAVRESAVAAGGDLSGTLDAAQIDPDAVGSSEIATDAVGSSEIAADAVGSGEIATDAVGSSEIDNDAVTASEILLNAVGSSEVAADAIGDAEIADSQHPIFLSAAELDDAQLNSAGRASSGTQSNWPAVLFDQATDESATFTAQVPPGIVGTTDLSLVWSGPGAGAVRWATNTITVTPNSVQLLSAPALVLNDVDVSSIPAGGRVDSFVYNSVAIAGGALVRITVTRDADSALDNLSGDAALLGVLIEPTLPR